MARQQQALSTGFQIAPERMLAPGICSDNILLNSLPRNENLIYEWRLIQQDKLALEFWVHAASHQVPMGPLFTELESLLNHTYPQLQRLMSPTWQQEPTCLIDITRQVLQRKQHCQLMPLGFKTMNWNQLEKIFAGKQGLSLSIKIRATHLAPWEYPEQTRELYVEERPFSRSQGTGSPVLIEVVEEPRFVTTEYWEVSIQIASQEPQLPSVLTQQLIHQLFSNTPAVHHALRPKEYRQASINLTQGKICPWVYNPLPEDHRRFLHLYTTENIQRFFRAPLHLPEKGVARQVQPRGTDLDTGIYVGSQPSGKKLHLPSLEQHALIVGKTGMGKSSLLLNMVLSQIEQGEGLAVIDPHGDLCQQILAHTPLCRLKDIIWLDTSLTEHPFGLNLLEIKRSHNMSDAKQQAELLAQELISMGIRLYGEEIFGPRIQNYALNGALTLMDDPSWPGTLIELPRLFTDEKYQKKRTENIRNPQLKAFWEQEFANTRDREKGEMIPYFNAKFAPFTSSALMSHIFGQGKSTLDFDAILKNQQILLVTLNQSLLGELACRMLSMVFLSKLSQAAFRQASMPFQQRQRYHLYLDEFQNFTTRSNRFSSGVNTNLCRILSEGRKYGLSLVMVTQYLKQLPAEIIEAIFGNVGTLIGFRSSLEDALRLSEEMQEKVSPEDLISQQALHAYASAATPRGQDVFSFQTSYDTGFHHLEADYIESIQELSALKYGTPVDKVAFEVEGRIYR